MRHPFVWAFLLGIVALTLIRPLLRRQPDPLPVLGPVPEFTLVDQHGRAFRSADLAGRVWVAHPFVASCPTSCPRLLETMRRLQDRLDASCVEGIHLVSIHVATEAIAPERLRAYAEQLGADPTRWTFLSGPAEHVRELLRGMEIPLGTQAHDHAGRLALVDAAGRYRGHVETLDRQDRYPGLTTSVEVAVDETFYRALQVLRERAAVVECPG